MIDGRNIIITDTIYGGNRPDSIYSYPVICLLNKGVKQSIVVKSYSLKEIVIAFDQKILTVEGWLTAFDIMKCKPDLILDCGRESLFFAAFTTPRVMTGVVIDARFYVANSFLVEGTLNGNIKKDYRK